MAEPVSDYTRGEMYVGEHEKTFHGFIKLSKWGSLYIAALLILLVVWFCTTAGFLAGLIAAVVVVGVGTVVLGEKHKISSH
jgi:hypothetical protein